RTAQASIYSESQSEVADVTTWTSTALQLIKARGVVRFIRIPTIHRQHSDTERIVRSRNAPLRANRKRAKARLPVEPIDERRIGQIRRLDGERRRHCDWQCQRRRWKHRRGKHDARQNAADHRTDARE